MNGIVALMRFALPTLVAALALSAFSSKAQSLDDEGTPDTWKFGVGAGLISGPRYPGSSENKVRALPLVSANYGRFFIGGLPGAGIPAGLGVNLIDRRDWKFGLGLGYDITKPRKESDDVRLRGLGDVSRTAHATLFGSYDQPWYRVRANVVTDIGGKHEGTQASLDLEGRYRLTPQLAVLAGPGLTWADKKYTQTFFGVNTAQSLSSGLAPYTAGSGLNTLRVSVGAEYAFSRSVFLGARASAGTLRGDARDSPITSSKSQNTFGLFGLYRF